MRIDVAEYVPQDGLKRRDRLPLDRDHADAHDPFARCLAVPKRLEQPAVKPGQHEPEQESSTIAKALDSGRAKSHHGRDHSENGHDAANRHIDQERRQTAKRSGDTVQESDVLGRDNLDAGVDLPVCISHIPHYLPQQCNPQEARRIGRVLPGVAEK